MNPTSSNVGLKLEFVKYQTDQLFIKSCFSKSEDLQFIKSRNDVTN
jgi:hypothetical protein